MQDTNTGTTRTDVGTPGSGTNEANRVDRGFTYTTDNYSPLLRKLVDDGEPVSTWGQLAGAAVWIVVMTLIVWFVSGCSIKLLNNGEIGFRQSTSWGFYHTTSQTGSIPSESKVEVPALDEWVSRKAETPPAPEQPTPETETPNP